MKKKPSHIIYYAKDKSGKWKSSWEVSQKKPITDEELATKLSETFWMTNGCRKAWLAVARRARRLLRK